MAKQVNRSEPWLRWIAPEEFADAELFRIVTFFVFHSPCPNISSMGKSLSEYGWNAPWKKPYYLNKQLRRAASNYNILYSATSCDTLEAALVKANLDVGIPSDLTTERIAIVDSKKNQFQSVFCHIRNALAHCRINMVEVNGECVFVMEDTKKSGERLNVSARMIIRKSTLLNWINIIEGGENEY